MGFPKFSNEGDGHKVYLQARGEMRDQFHLEIRGLEDIACPAFLSFQHVVVVGK